MLPPSILHTHNSPNFATRAGVDIDTIVLHNTAGQCAGALHRLCDDSVPLEKRVSAHYCIDRDGTIYQLVGDVFCAWHAGVRTVNRASIGIELVAHSKARGMTPEQEAALVSLIRYLRDRYQIPLNNIIPHRRVKATACPGYVWATDAALEQWKQKHFEVKS